MKCWITGVGMMYPMFSASSCFRDWNAMPTHSPLSLKAGPPLFPLLIAASICTPRSSLDPCTYAVTSIRLTTPLVTEMVSPPIGYPTTVTASWRRGSGPKLIGLMPFQNSSSSTVSIAMSHSVPVASTVATYFVSDPRRLTLTWVWCSTECALVSSLRPPMTKPLLLDWYWRFLCHGSEKLGSVCVQKTLTTESMNPGSTPSNPSSSWGPAGERGACCDPPRFPRPPFSSNGPASSAVRLAALDRPGDRASALAAPFFPIVSASFNGPPKKMRLRTLGG
mmetsp:Transcript_40593/g.129474  ORF Transcript_40593/g.129474 Transcript_40593/m.129474 type:complete len:279 (-) Transcript_40593:73-909(-)